MSKVCIREAIYQDIPGIWKLCSQEFNEFRGSSLEDFRSLCDFRFFNNPSRQPFHPFGWVLEESENIVGFVGLVPVVFKIKNEIVVGASGTSWCVDPAFRSFSFLLYKELMKWGDRHFLIDTTAGPVAEKFHQTLKMGMKPLPLPHLKERFFWVLDPTKFVFQIIHNRIQKKILKQTLRAWPIPNFLGQIGKTFLWGQENLSYPKIGRYIVSEINHFLPDFDQFWLKVSHHFDVTVVRDSKFLNWRHFQLPNLGGKAYVFKCEDKYSKELVGYVALQQRGHCNSFPGHYLITDIFCDPYNIEIVKACLNRVSQFLKDERGVLFEISGLPEQFHNISKTQRPWVRCRTSYPYWVKYRDLFQTHWWPSGLDGDQNI